MDLACSGTSSAYRRHIPITERIKGMVRVEFTAPFKYPFFSPPSTGGRWTSPIRKPSARSQPSMVDSPASARDRDDGDLPPGVLVVTGELKRRRRAWGLFRIPCVHLAPDRSTGSVPRSTRIGRSFLMALSQGDKLGPYEILSRLGAGGMGEVWKARDTRLDRIVAIKQLKGQHIARFEQEARAIAALNHPHICQIYDVGQDYLVLEYIEGRPLTGPLPLPEVVRVAGEITDALQLRASPETNSSRLEAGQHSVVGERLCQAPGFRVGEAGNHGACRFHTNRGGDRYRHCRLHGARAGGRKAARRTIRHIQLRRGPVRDDLRNAGLHRPLSRAGAVQCPARRSSGARDDARASTDCQEVSGPSARQTVFRTQPN